MLFSHSNICSYGQYFLIQRALDIMQSVPKQANDTMHVGMLEGFSVSTPFDDLLISGIITGVVFVVFIQLKFKLP